MTDNELDGLLGDLKAYDQAPVDVAAFERGVWEKVARLRRQHHRRTWWLVALSAGLSSAATFTLALCLWTPAAPVPQPVAEPVRPDQVVPKETIAQAPQDVPEDVLAAVEVVPPEPAPETVVPLVIRAKHGGVVIAGDTYAVPPARGYTYVAGRGHIWFEGFSVDPDAHPQVLAAGSSKVR